MPSGPNALHLDFFCGLCRVAGRTVVRAVGDVHGLEWTATRWPCIRRPARPVRSACCLATSLVVPPFPLLASFLAGPILACHSQHELSELQTSPSHPGNDTHCSPSTHAFFAFTSTCSTPTVRNVSACIEQWWSNHTDSARAQRCEERALWFR